MPVLTPLKIIMKRSKRIYLAAPYTHKDPVIMQKRYEIITDVATDLIQAGFHVYSPITHAHHINLRLENRSVSFFHWIDFDLRMIGVWSDEIFVLPLEGVEHSVGVRHEISFAMKIKKPIFYLTEKVGGWITDSLLLPKNFVQDEEILFTKIIEELQNEHRAGQKD